MFGIYFTLHVFVTKRILKMQIYLHTYITLIKLLYIRRLLYVGNLHLPTFIYIQDFDRIFLNDFRHFSLGKLMEKYWISSTFLGDFQWKVP